MHFPRNLYWIFKTIMQWSLDWACKCNNLYRVVYTSCRTGAVAAWTYTGAATSNCGGHSYLALKCCKLSSTFQISAGEVGVKEVLYCQGILILFVMFAVNCSSRTMTHRKMVRLLSSLKAENAHDKLSDTSIGPVKSNTYQYLQESVVNTAVFQRSLPR